MAHHALAGKPVPRDLVVHIPRLMAAYFAVKPDPREPLQRVAFGTSGHRGTSLAGSFNDDHIAAICQAVAEVRAAHGIEGPLLMGMDTHALSEAAFTTALEVFAANGVTVHLDRGDPGPAYTPTPALSHAILRWNARGEGGRADGVVITPSHNPPEDGGFKYNPPTGGPADAAMTGQIQDRANALLEAGLRGVRRTTIMQARRAATTREVDFMTPYVEDLARVLDMDAMASSGLKIGADPMGGAGAAYWEPIADRYGLCIEVVNPVLDPTFSFMTLDRDGKTRMDCSSPYAMANLVGLKDRFDIAFGNDPDFDRHGVVTKTGGLMRPNHYLSVAIEYLFRRRTGWPEAAAVGKTLVSSSMIDRVARDLGRRLAEVPVGFKWFVDGLLDGTYGFGGEESAGASFLRRDGSVWTTDKDGILLNLLAAEITAVTGKDPSERYASLQERFGTPVYERMDAPATRAQKAALANLSPDQVTATDLAGEPISAKLTHAPGNGAPIGGLKVVTENGWFAARPSGTEELYKIYAESFLGEEHLRRIQEEAQAMVRRAFEAVGVRE